MKAVGYESAGAIERQGALQNINLDTPQAEGRDLLVRIEAVSVNPVDTKLRRAREPEGWGVLGFDACGVVEAVGAEVQSFKPGDAVFYAGTLGRPGTNSEYHLVDERLVGFKPASLSSAEAAALPLTAVTAWEMLFDRLNVKVPPAQGGKLILVIGGGGGVGSIAIELLRALTDITIIATASRQETRDWARKCGAHHVIDHSQPLAAQIDQLGLGAPGLVFSTTQTDKHYTDIIGLIAPQGRFGLIDDPGDISVMPLKQKSVSLHWEYMFTRSVFSTPDMARQGEILNELARLVDAGQVFTTMTEVAGTIDAESLARVHRRIESGSVRGKIVLEGFGNELQSQ